MQLGKVISSIFPLYHYLDIAIGQVLHIAKKRISAGQLLGSIPKANPLDVSRKTGLYPFHRLVMMVAFRFGRCNLAN